MVGGAVARAHIGIGVGDSKPAGVMLPERAAEPLADEKRMEAIVTAASRQGCRINPGQMARPEWPRRVLRGSVPRVRGVRSPHRTDH